MWRRYHCILSDRNENMRRQGLGVRISSSDTDPTTCNPSFKNNKMKKSPPLQWKRSNIRSAMFFMKHKKILITGISLLVPVLIIFSYFDVGGLGIFYPTTVNVITIPSKPKQLRQTSFGHDYDSGGSGGYIRPDSIYGHIHFAKTGGSSLNGLLANNYERVCGNKGVSYDAYAKNVQFRKHVERNHHQKNNKYEMTNEDLERNGWENCDYISMEHKWDYWEKFNDFHGLHMELHLPCRDPIDHLMSQCNHVHRKEGFNCTGSTDEEILSHIEFCIRFQNRFSIELNNTKKYPNLHLKCFDFEQEFTTYLTYMDERLQPRRLVSEYVQRETNKKRDKDRECIWSNEPLKERVLNLLLENYDYYKFCDRCIGSDQDITLKAKDDKPLQ